jgi:hypothetical protein
MPNDQPNLQRAPAPARSVEVITDAVIMAYIHEISARHRRPDASAGAPGVGEASA